MAKIAVRIVTTGPTGTGSQLIDKKCFKQSEMVIVTGTNPAINGSQPLPITQAQYDASPA